MRPVEIACRFLAAAQLFVCSSDKRQQVRRGIRAIRLRREPGHDFIRVAIGQQRAAQQQRRIGILGLPPREVVELVDRQRRVAAPKLEDA